MKQPVKKRAPDHRTTVSVAMVVWDMAHDLMESKGFNGNFSSYVADLIRRDHEAYMGNSRRGFTRDARQKWGGGGGGRSLDNPPLETKLNGKGHH